ncbi:DUF4350 domain-containing protein [Streptomyces abyssomicinicus]|uniref:DUF4350 domain-containing protein n=1 Tax=Streptomyces abyssomicinicus TaxID=574929 RepID=UPI00125087A4|nr:DUF4350 domain-containing protein [Streptomyces abyssomicinicus]
MSTTASTSTSPTARHLWARGRGVLLGLVALVVAGIALAATRADDHGPLDPRSPGPNGARAVAEILRGHGVDTRVVTTLAEATTATGPDTTLVVAVPDLLTEAQLTAVREATTGTGGRLLLIAPDVSTPALVPGVTADLTPAFDDTAAPSCALPAAEDAGTAETTGIRYRVDAPDADSCYPSDGLPTLVRVPAETPGDPGNPGGDTVVVGSPAFLINDRLDEHGNASLAMNLLGSRPDLVWYIPSLADASATTGDEQQGLFDLMPSGWLWGTFQLFLAAVVAALWRGRRFGPLVAERLPVVVRASETTEGRARLYHAAKARDRAAEALRTATRLRLAPLTGVPAARAHAAEALLPAVAARINDPAQAAGLQDLLFGPPPGDDAALVSLADRLDALEREVSRP